jgi:phosphate transport system permease protein
MPGTLSHFRQKGDPYVLLTSMGLVLSLGMVAFMISLILVKGLGFFWPGDLLEVKLDNGQSYLGELWASQTVTADNKTEDEIQLKIGNRDLYGQDFIWLKTADISKKFWPDSATTFERLTYGNFYGFIESVKAGDEVVTGSPLYLFQKARVYHDSAMVLSGKINDVSDQLNNLMAPYTRLQREISLLKMKQETLTEEEQNQLADYQEKLGKLQERITQSYQDLSGELQKLQQKDRNLSLTVITVEGKEEEIQLSGIVRFYQPNRLSAVGKSRIYLSKVWEFLTAQPRESNTEGGVFPAIFGTVMMVLLMSIAVVPFGVLAALYLNEYARQGTVIRLIRLSVNNLAGVPSIVFGIFGLGFFIYIVGGTIDQLFYADKLPEPTFGTGGILWASLTLALLTLPVVVVATEEGILAVPRANKEGALALGATRWQMIRKIVLPNAMPGILTGLILAISRGAGEVAPLMITGVVKLAPSLPVDGTFPFLHLDRKFMHLGFQIYDVGFQSPNVEAAKPMVYTTALLLIVIVVILNLVAIYLRNRLRKKYKSSVF